MSTIGIIAEGVTDQLLLERFLYVLCGTDEKPNITFLQPANTQEPGNWDRVLKYVGSERFRGAFQNVDFVVVHVDTDVCDRFNPPISRNTTDGEAVEAKTLIAQVRQHLIAEINRNAPEYYNQRSEQIIFAIAVHSMECWLLPLYYDRDNQRRKTDNCLKSLNEKLSPLKFSIDENAKRKGYETLLRTDKIRKLKRDAVLQMSQYNPGFQDFVAQTEALLNIPAPDAVEEP